MADLVDGQLTFSPQGDGKTVKVLGKVKEIKEAWDGFSPGATGYFVPFWMPKVWVGHNVTISGGDNDKTLENIQDTVDGRLLVTKIDGFLTKTGKQTFTVDGVEALVVDYSGITKVAAVIRTKTKVDAKKK